MVSIANVVTDAARGASSSALTIPRPLMVFYMAAHQVHRVWRWIRLGKIYSNPDNFLALSAGHGVNALFGKSILLRISAVSVLIATRILECVEQQTCVQTAWTHLTDAYHDHYTVAIKVEWDSNGKKFLSSSTMTWCRFQYKKTTEKTKRIALCTFQLIKEAFILSMKMIDTIETFYLSPSTQNEGINQLFVNGTRWVEKLVDNKELLIDGLVSNKTLIEKILKGVHSPFTSDQLIETTRSALEKTEKFHSTIQGANKDFGGFVIACGKKWGYEFLHNLGLHHLVPNELVPPSSPPWEIPPHQRINERYPPILKITRPSKIPKPIPVPVPAPILAPIVATTLLPIPVLEKSKPTQLKILEKTPPVATLEKEQKGSSRKKRFSMLSSKSPRGFRTFSKRG